MVENTVVLNLRIGLPKLKEVLMTPYPRPEIGNRVFTQALGTINLLERDADWLRGAFMTYLQTENECGSKRDGKPCGNKCGCQLELETYFAAFGQSTGK